MTDWRRVRGFEWDEGNRRKNSDKHRVSQAEAEEIFFHLPLVVASDESHSRTEQRFHALGHTATGRLLHLTFTLRRDDERIRVISARTMSRRERRIYEQAHSSS